MKNTVFTFIFTFAFLLISCKNNKSIDISKKEYSAKKNDGFWNLRNEKAIRYNQNVAKPHRDKQMKKLARENKQIERANSKQRKRFRDNETLHKTYDHH
mgnify:CR=1 FL=1